MTECFNGKHTCCICGTEFEGWGNNPQPINEEGRCCDSCNTKYVIPSRIFIAELLQDVKRQVK